MPPQPSPAPKVTVAIPTYNRAAFLRQTLAGIAAQRFPREAFEVLVIDNNSTDDTRAVVAEFAGERPAPRHILETRQGLDFARNRAVAEARGEIIVFGDDDILVETDWLAQMTAPLLSDQPGRIGAVGGEVVPVFPDGLPRVFDQLGLFHTALDRAAGNYFSGGDSEMIRRVRQAGLEVWFVPAAAVRHQMPASRTTFRYAARHAFDSARSRVIDRAGQPGATAYLAGRLLANVLKVAGFAFLALLNALVFRTGAAKQALVRAWRSCGYLYQIPRSLLGRI
jgi:glycosyltransferase involved in cell wall biosynthesis